MRVPELLLESSPKPKFQPASGMEALAMEVNGEERAQQAVVVDALPYIDHGQNWRLGLTQATQNTNDKNKTK